MKFGKGILNPKRCSYPNKKGFERKKAKIREREGKRKSRMEEFRERECQYSEKMGNGTPEEQEREHVHQEEFMRNGH